LVEFCDHKILEIDNQIILMELGSLVASLVGAVVDVVVTDACFLFVCLRVNLID
jgi:hypothetical protein